MLAFFSWQHNNICYMLAELMKTEFKYPPFFRDHPFAAVQHEVVLEMFNPLALLWMKFQALSVPVGLELVHGAKPTIPEDKALYTYAGQLIADQAGKIAMGTDPGWGPRLQMQFSVGLYQFPNRRSQDPLTIQATARQWGVFTDAEKRPFADRSEGGSEMVSVSWAGPQTGTLVVPAVDHYLVTNNPWKNPYTELDLLLDFSQNDDPMLNIVDMVNVFGKRLLSQTINTRAYGQVSALHQAAR